MPFDIPILGRATDNVAVVGMSYRLSSNNGISFGPETPIHITAGPSVNWQAVLGGLENDTYVLRVSAWDQEGNTYSREVRFAIADAGISNWVVAADVEDHGVLFRDVAASLLAENDGVRVRRWNTRPGSAVPYFLAPAEDRRPDIAIHQNQRWLRFAGVAVTPREVMDANLPFSIAGSETITVAMRAAMRAGVMADGVSHRLLTLGTSDTTAYRFHKSGTSGEILADFGALVGDARIDALGIVDDVPFTLLAVVTPTLHTVYLNGTLVDSLSHSYSRPPINTARIGLSASDGDAARIRVHWVRLFMGALSPAQIAELSGAG